MFTFDDGPRNFRDVAFRLLRWCGTRMWRRRFP